MDSLPGNMGVSKYRGKNPPKRISLKFHGKKNTYENSMDLGRGGGSFTIPIFGSTPIEVQPPTAQQILVHHSFRPGPSQLETRHIVVDLCQQCHTPLPKLRLATCINGSHLGKQRKQRGVAFKTNPDMTFHYADWFRRDPDGLS